MKPRNMEMLEEKPLKRMRDMQDYSYDMRQQDQKLAMTSRLDETAEAEWHEEGSQHRPNNNFNPSAGSSQAMSLKAEWKWRYQNGFWEETDKAKKVFESMKQGEKETWQEIIM